MGHNMGRLNELFILNQLNHKKLERFGFISKEPKLLVRALKKQIKNNNYVNKITILNTQCAHKI